MSLHTLPTSQSEQKSLARLNKLAILHACDGILTALQPIATVWALEVLASQVLFPSGRSARFENALFLIGALIFAFAMIMLARRLLLWPVIEALYHEGFGWGMNKRKSLLEYLVSLPLGTFNRLNKGRIAQILSEDMLWLENYRSFARPHIWSDCLAILVLLIAAAVWNWHVVAGAVVGFALASIAILLMRRSLQRGLRYRAAGLEMAAQEIVEFVQGMPVLRSFGGGYGARERYDRSVSMIRTGFRKSIFRNAPTGAVYLMAVQASVGLGFLAGLLLMKGTLAQDQIIPLLTSVLLVASSISHARSLNSYSTMQMLSDIANEKVTDLHREKPTLSGSHTEPPSDWSVTFDDVGFRYDGADHEALKAVSFHAQSNSFTAVVGKSGAGKSSLMQLLLRFWDCQSGMISIGGLDIRHMQTALLQEQIATVFQDTILFNDSVRNNLLIGNPDADQAGLEAAARAAQIHDFILSLPDGYDTNIGVDGNRLSGGQRQRLAIARAILKDAPIIILDEATSALDPENEAAIQTAFQALARNKTLFVIAHRLSTITRADQILVMDEGRLVDSGSHDILLERCDVYRSLWQHYRSSEGWQIRPN